MGQDAVCENAGVWGLVREAGKVAVKCRGCPQMLAILTTLLFLLAGCFGVGNSNQTPVPVVPNDSLVAAEVYEYAIVNSILEDIQPEQTLYVLQIKILSSEDVDQMRNFTKDKVDEIIRVYSREELSPELFGKTITANVKFTGDEHGGKFWIRNVNEVEEE